MSKKTAPEPVTLEATLLWVYPDRLTAFDSRGYLYHWTISSLKSLGYEVKEGDMMFVNADPDTKEVFSMYPTNGDKAV